MVATWAVSKHWKGMKNIFFLHVHVDDRAGSEHKDCHRAIKKLIRTSKDSKCDNRPFSYSTKEPGSSDIFIQFYTRGSIEWR